MNRFEHFEFPAFVFVETVIAGILLAFILGIIRRNVLPKTRIKGIKQGYPFFEIAIWVMYGLWMLHILLGDSIYHILALAIISAMVVFWLGWFVARDFFAGIVLRLTEKYKAGQFFTFNEMSGTIIDASNLCLKLRRQDGVTVEIPYSKIIGTVQFKAQADNKISLHRFDIQVTKRLSLEETRDIIRTAVLLSAGASIKKEPQIILKKSQEQFWQFEVVAYAVSPEYYQLIEQNVRTIG